MFQFYFWVVSVANFLTARRCSPTGARPGPPTTTPCTACSANFEALGRKCRFRLRRCGVGPRFRTASRAARADAGAASRALRAVPAAGSSSPHGACSGARRLEDRQPAGLQPLRPKGAPPPLAPGRRRTQRAETAAPGRPPLAQRGSGGQDPGAQTRSSAGPRRPPARTGSRSTAPRAPPCAPRAPWTPRTLPAAPRPPARPGVPGSALTAAPSPGSPRGRRPWLPTQKEAVHVKEQVGHWPQREHGRRHCVAAYAGWGRTGGARPSSRARALWKPCAPQAAVRTRDSGLVVAAVRAAHARARSWSPNNPTPSRASSRCAQAPCYLSGPSERLPRTRPPVLPGRLGGSPRAISTCAAVCP